ncbi:MAG: urease accessory protein UreD, partial [Pseudomonadota bacterium]
ETILFDGASLDRKFNAHLADKARLTALETVILGREAMQETLESLAFRDDWRVRHNQKLVHADTIRLTSESLQEMNKKAHLCDHLVFGTFIDVEPSRPTMDQRDKLAFLERISKASASNDTVNVGASIFDQKTVVRFTARSSYHLRQTLPDLLNQIVPDSKLPTVWRL